jgi:23S rRNA (guanosine2251-2'-O)-methyltransferase
MEDKGQMIFGTRAVIEAVQAGKEIDRVFVQKGLSNDLYHQLRKALRDAFAPIQVVPVEKLNRLTSGNHQGVIAFITEVAYYRTEDLLPELFSQGKIPLVMILDRVTDVRNFGAIARSAECAGADFVIVPSRGSAPVGGDAIKTSAGALHRLKVCREENLKSTIDFLRDSGVQVVACHEKTETLIYDVNLTIPTALLLGGEESGISGEYLRRCDAQGKIPMGGTIASLNVSVAAGIVLFEAVRQRLQR